MTININRIPAPNTLIVFEASARHLSFTKAAAELNMTQAAVSKQIIQLEERLRVQLFVRAPRILMLTEQGKKLYAAVFSSLGQIAHAVADIRSQGSALVTLSASSAFITLWLLPRLHDFANGHPDINLRFIASDRSQHIDATSTHLIVRYGNNSMSGAQPELLFAVQVFPVCSPALREHRGFRRLEQLAELPLLELTTEHWQGMDWDQWFKQADYAPSAQHVRFYFNDYVMLQQATEMGHGVCLAWSGLSDHALKEGRLVVPLRQRVDAPNGWGYYLSEQIGVARRPEVCAVRDWLMQQAAAN